MRTRLVAVAVALVLVALGVAIGAGPLQGDSDRNRREARNQQDAVAQRDAEIKQLTAASALGSGYAAATTTKVLAGRLTGRSVALITMPGSDQGTVEAIAGLVSTAGGQVTARVGLSAALLEPSSEGLVAALSSQMVTQSAGVVVPTGATGYQRIGALLARGIGVLPSTRTVRAAYDPVAISILSGLQAAKLVDTADITARAGLAIVVLPASSEDGPASTLTSILGSYASQIPSVVGGPASSAGAGEVLALLRSDPGSRASTVDSAESSIGQVITVLALAAQTRAVVGDYGVIGSVDAAVPPDS